MMDEPEVDLEFCYYSGSDEGDNIEDEQPEISISEYVNSVRNELKNENDVKIELPHEGDNCVETKNSQSENHDYASSSGNETDDEPTLIKRVGRRKKAIVSIKSFRKNIRRLSRHKLKFVGKQKSQKEKENEIMADDVEQPKKNGLKKLNQNVEEKKENELKNLNHILDNLLDAFSHDAQQEKQNGTKELTCDIIKVKEMKDEVENINPIVEQNISDENKSEIVDKNDKNEMENDVQSSSCDEEQQTKDKVYDSEVNHLDINTSKVDTIENENKQEQKNETKQIDSKQPEEVELRKFNLRKRSRTETVDRDAKIQKPNESKDIVATRRSSTRQSKVKARVGITKTAIDSANMSSPKSSKPIDSTARRMSPRATPKRTRSPTLNDEKLMIEPVGDSTTLYKDSLDYLYRKKVTYPKAIYIVCKEQRCPVSVIYDVMKGTARMLGEHAHGPVDKNDIQMMELNQMIRAKSYDSKLNHIHGRELYLSCIAKFKGISLPESHCEKTIEIIRYHRKHAAKKPNGGQKTPIHAIQLSKPTEIITTPKSSGSRAKPKSMPKNSVFEPIGSETLFKDAQGKIYRKMAANSKRMYLRCLGENCSVSARYNLVDKTVKFFGKHSNHPNKQNDILLIELNFLIRSRAMDPNYDHVRAPDLYDQCVDEFHGKIIFPDGHRLQAYRAINNGRKRIRRVSKENPDAKIKMHTTLPKSVKFVQQTPTEPQEIRQKKSPISVPKEEPPKKVVCTCTCGCHDAASRVETPAKIEAGKSIKSIAVKDLAKSPTKTPTSGRGQVKDPQKRQQPTILSFLSKINNKTRATRASV